MMLLPHHWWAPILLAGVLALDVALSIRPARFIVDCLDGVGFPRQ